MKRKFGTTILLAVVVSSPYIDWICGLAWKSASYIDWINVLKYQGFT